MATKARQQYHADEVTLSKDKREFSISDAVQEKIEGIEEGAQVNTIETIRVNGNEVQPDENKAIDLTIPGVIDSLSSTSITDALSARQGKVLYDYIEDLSRIGHFLALWNASEGLPVTDPETSPYVYNSGDFYIISVVAELGGTNYKPSGTEYVIGQASTEVEVDDISVNDFYFYDGDEWRHMTNSGAGNIIIDPALSTTSTHAVENRVVTNALNNKADDSAVVKLTGNQTIAGTKTFSTSPVVPSKTTSATNTGTAIATEAQVYKKQDTLVSGNNIKTINSNSLLGSGDISITGFYPSNAGSTGNVLTKTATGYNWAAPASQVSDTAYASSWNGVTTTAPSKNAVYDKISAMDTTIGSKANDSDVVKLTGDQTIAGTKTFSTSPVVPSKTTDAANTGTAIATEAQVYKKQDALVSGTNIKTINSNSLLGSGNIVLNDVKVSAAAPSSPTEGMVWYDTTNDQLKVYDGTNRNVTGKEYHAGEGIEIGNKTDYSAMQGPSPDGFHVPSATEWQGVNTIMTSLSLTTSDSWRINLHMPLVGFRVNTNASLYTQGSNGVYWSSSPSSWTSTYARSLNLSPYGLYVDSESDRASSVSVRCFKDSYVEPTSSWTVIQGTLGGAGIFWNQNEGLISVTNGTTGYTMMDKNLGATTVYNNGDTLTQANMGNMYQWGNNYGFPSTGTISNTSSTQVDASAYGPTNPYSSDTFITGSSDWSSVQNDDLWGNTTGIITQENVISNTGVLSVNGQTGDVTISTPEESNTKTFYLSSTSDLTNAQAAYDWYIAGKNPIVVYGTEKPIYTVYDTSDGLRFRSSDSKKSAGTSSTMINYWKMLSLVVSNGNVTSISTGDYTGNAINVLGTSINYSTPYTPQYPGSPATKKYVDDKVIASSTAPSSPTEGQIWYDTTNDKLKVYNGTSWDEAGGGAGDMLYSDFNWVTKTGNSITLDLASKISPTANFTVNAPSTIKDGQTYILRVDSGGTTYTMSLGTNITNPYNVTTDLTLGGIDQFVFLAIGGKLELQPDFFDEGGGGGGGGGDYVAGSGISISGGVIRNTGVLSVNGNTGAVTVNEFAPGGTATTGYVVKKTASGYEWAAESSQVSDVAYASSWDGVTTTAPSKNAVYDKISAMDTTIGSKANDSDVVKLSGNQTISGTKTFSASPVVPSKTTAAANTGTAIATEAQVYKKQDTLVSGTNIKTINNTTLLGSGNITALTAETVVSGNSGTTYTIKVSNTAPAAGTPNTTITFVTE